MIGFYYGSKIPDLSSNDGIYFVQANGNTRKTIYIKGEIFIEKYSEDVSEEIGELSQKLFIPEVSENGILSFKNSNENE